MDGDGQHQGEYIQELQKIVEEDICDVAIGSRFLLRESYPLGILKALGVRAFRMLIRIFTGERITDPTSGFQCLSRKAFGYLTGDDFPWDYPDANVIIMLHRAGFRIGEVPVFMRPNPEGREMHRGALTISYYLFTVLLSILVTVIRKSK